MNNKIEISQFDVKSSQLITWLISVIFLFLVCVVIFLSFSKSGALILVLVLIIMGTINYFSSKMWNISYSDGQLYINNIYKTHIVSIEEFDKVEMVNLFGYSLLLVNGKSYNFKISPTDDLKLFF